MIIQLTTSNRGRPIFVETSHIISFRKIGDGVIAKQTNVLLTRGEYNVKESPEEIQNLIEAAAYNWHSRINNEMVDRISDQTINPRRVELKSE